MADVQKENGYTSIADEIVDQLMKVNLSPQESRVLWAIFRKTYGFQKKTDWISLSQFSALTGMDRRHVHRALRKLSSKQMITVTQMGDSKKISYGFQKDYELWLLSPKRVTPQKLSPKQMTTVTQTDDELSPKQVPTKDIITKDSIIITPPTPPLENPKKVKIVLPEWLPKALWSEFKKMRIKVGAPLTEYAEERAISKLSKLRADGEDPEDVINQSIDNSWKGLFEVKKNGNRYRNQGSAGKAASEKSSNGDQSQIEFPIDLTIDCGSGESKDTH